MKFKYNIKKRLLQLPVREYRRLRKEIPKNIGKTLRTFDRYCNLKQDDFADIPAKDLDIIAFFLECKADSLKNYIIDQKEQQQIIVRFKK